MSSNRLPQSLCLCEEVNPTLRCLKSSKHVYQPCIEQTFDPAQGSKDLQRYDLWQLLGFLQFSFSAESSAQEERGVNINQGQLTLRKKQG